MNGENIQFDDERLYCRDQIIITYGNAQARTYSLKIITHFLTMGSKTPYTPLNVVAEWSKVLSAVPWSLIV